MSDWSKHQALLLRVQARSHLKRSADALEDVCTAYERLAEARDLFYQAMRDTDWCCEDPNYLMAGRGVRNAHRDVQYMVRKFAQAVGLIPAGACSGEVAKLVASLQVERHLLSGLDAGGLRYLARAYRDLAHGAYLWEELQAFAEKIAAVLGEEYEPPGA